MNLRVYFYGILNVLTCRRRQIFLAVFCSAGALSGVYASRFNENLEGVAHTMGIKRAFLIRDVLIPQCKHTLVEMFSYFFVNCMMTISAVSFLANTRNKPVSLMINQFEAQMQLECAAVVSLMILLTNLIIKGVAYLMKKSKVK